MPSLNHVIPAPVDAIFGINIAFAKDPREHKLNASVGTYKNEQLTPYILPSVKLAEEIILKSEKSKEYLPISGDPEFLKLSQALVFGQRPEPRVAAIQTLGGTGALRLAGDLLHHVGYKNIYVGTPTWINHQAIFSHAGLQVHEFPYLGNLIGQIEAIPPQSILIMQASCHNPTGQDPTLEQWQAIVKIAHEKQLFVVFDLAYQGFGGGLSEDVQAISLFYQAGLSFAVAVSHSKNFGLYAERIGALFVMTEDACQAEKVLSRLKVFARTSYSNPCCHGSSIIRTILQSDNLKNMWMDELSCMRGRIQMMRQSLIFELQVKGLAHLPAFKGLDLQKGMFAFPTFKSHLVERLKNEFAIYLTLDGRINLAGLNAEAVKKLTTAFLALHDDL